MANKSSCLGKGRQNTSVELFALLVYSVYRKNVIKYDIGGWGGHVARKRRLPTINSSTYNALGFEPTPRAYFCAPIQDTIGTSRLLYFTPTSTFCAKRGSYTVSFCLSSAMGFKLQYRVCIHRVHALINEAYGSLTDA